MFLDQQAIPSTPPSRRPPYAWGYYSQWKGGLFKAHDHPPDSDTFGRRNIRQADTAGRVGSR